MALASLGPWNTPPDFLGAIRSGAALGLQAREADTRATETADRLSLAYQSLAAKERMASENLQGKLQLADAALQQRQRNADALQAYRANQLGLREARGTALDEWRANKLEQEKAAADLRTSLAQQGLDLRSQMLNLQQNVEAGRANRFATGQANKGVLDRIKRLSTDKAHLSRDIAESIDDGEKATKGKQIQAIDSQISDLENQLMSGGPADAGGPQSAPVNPKDPLGILK